MTAITGHFKTPDGLNITGKVLVQLSRSSVKNICSTPAQVVPFKPLFVTITTGTLGSLSLYATPCLSPSLTYDVIVYDSRGNQLYRTKWNVPNVASIDVSAIDVSEQGHTH